MIYHFILNPKSGKKTRDLGFEDAINTACKKRKLSFHIYYTTQEGDATEYVRSMIRISQEKQRFICVGGDGTINEIVNSAPENLNVEFGVIPRGSGNDFVRNFTNGKKFHDIEAQLDGEPVTLNLIRCNNGYCVNMVNIGFDCAVAKEADAMKKKHLVPGSLSYIFGVVKVLFRKFGTPMKLIFDDGEIIDSELLLTAIGNGQYCGGGFDAVPKAVLNDGLMDVCIINKITRFTFLKLVKSYKSGTHLENKKAQSFIRYRRVSHFRMEFESPIPICVDGEIKGAKSIDFEVVPNGFRFVIPKGCKLKLSAAEQPQTATV